jgi:ArsR family transcriptional regulator, arsenate/arsenite/antimonite-responsive transcriptional repressor
MNDVAVIRMLKALAHPKRFRMVQEIAAAGELSCSQLSKKFTLSQPTVSHHLRQLVDANVLVVRQQAQHHFISINRDLLDQLGSLLPRRLTKSRS